MDKEILQTGNKIHFTSLGCARNLVDTEVMLGIVLKAGYELTGEETEADFLVVNTCGFLESARQEALETIEDIFSLKKPHAKVVVAGCMVPKHGTILKETFPDIHYMLGPGDVENILGALDSGEQGISISSAKSYLQWGEIPRQIATPKHYAYLKIAEGCAKRCSFCIIPTIKGKLKSKTQDQILKEFRSLLSQGVQEVIFIAQDLGDYGKERKEPNGLESLLKEVTKIEGDYWIRLLYLYPDEITDELIEVMQKDKRILPYLDMPIQHINDQILKKMRRKTNREHIVETYTKLRRAIPDIVIRTSLMVGFPGETEEAFEELCQFVQDYPFDNIGVFQFSLEKEAHAATLPDQLSDDIKQERYEQLMQIQEAVVERGNQKYLGQTLKVLVESVHPDSEWLMQGRFYGQCPDIDGQVIINDCEAIDQLGQFYEVEITDILGYDLVGKAIRPVSKTRLKKKSSLAIIS